MISELEIRRKFFHLLFGIILVVLIGFNVVNKFTVLIFLIIAYGLCLWCKKDRNAPLYWVLRHFEREKDLVQFPGKGALYYLMGAAFVVIAFDKDIAMASVLILAIGDSVSHIVGKFGNIKSPLNSKKFLEGSIAGGIAAFIAAFFVLGNGWEAFFGVFAGMIIEGMDIKFRLQKIDDNLLVPITSGLVIWLVRFIFNFI